MCTVELKGPMHWAISLFLKRWCDKPKRRRRRWDRENTKKDEGEGEAEAEAEAAKPARKLTLQQSKFGAKKGLRFLPFPLPFFGACVYYGRPFKLPFPFLGVGWGVMFMFFLYSLRRSVRGRGWTVMGRRRRDRKTLQRFR